MCEPTNTLIFGNAQPFRDLPVESDPAQSKVKLLLNDNILSANINEERLALPLSQHHIHEEKQKSDQEICVESCAESSLLMHVHSFPLRKESEDARAIAFPIQDMIMEQLKEKDLQEWFLKHYLSFEKKTILISEDLYQDIKQISDPEIIELLFKLNELCELKTIKDEEALLIFHFIWRLVHQEIIKNINGEERSNNFKNISQTVGELIYFIERNPKKIFDLLGSGVSDEQNVIDIAEGFSDEIKKVRLDLDRLYKDHASVPLQSPALAVSFMIPKVLADIMLISTGAINGGVIDRLIETFVGIGEPLYGYRRNLHYALTFFKRSQKFRMLFESIVKPLSTKLASNNVVLASLNLDPTTIVDDLTSKRAVLGALMSHLRQIGEGSCFATSLAIEILSSHLTFCLRDLIGLVEHGNLTRMIGGVIRDIPFLQKIYDNTLDQFVLVDDDGYVINNKVKGGLLWQAPGIIAACQAIGVKKPKQAILEILRTMPYLGKYRHFTVNILFEELCWNVQNPGKSRRLFRKLYDQACFSFSSQTVHPLLKIWENTIASMAEVREGGVIKKGILQSILYSIQLKLTRLKIQPSPCIKQSLLTIQKTLFEKIELRYDPAIKTSMLSQRANPGGGFVLYYQNKRIDNSIDFTEFMKNILNEVFEVLKRNEAVSIFKEELDKLFEILIPYISSDEFLIEVLVKYHHTNQLERNLPKVYEKLTYTPWITKMGNNSGTVLEVYLEAKQPLVSEKFTIENAQQRLAKIIGIGQEMSESDQLTHVNHSQKLVPFRLLGHHSGSLMLGHPSLIPAWLRENSIEEWIEENLIKPGQSISDESISEVTKILFLSKIEKNILPIYMDIKNRFLFKELMEKIPHQISIYDFRTKLIRLYKKFEPNINKKMIVQIDTALCESLEPVLKKKLKSVIVHFADTNWSNQMQNLHFCFMVNPGTRQLEMWECTEDGNQLFAIDQNEWLIDQPWEIFRLPQDIFPDDNF